VNGDLIDNDVTGQVLAELADCVRRIPGKSITEAAILIEKSPRIFVAGAGRSGLCMRALAMRLMHLGMRVFVVGETTTPGIRAGDLLIVGSGSGLTIGLLAISEQARLQGAVILLLTADSNSPLAALSNQQVIIPAAISEDGKNWDHVASAQPLATLFEQALLILNDCIILEMMQRGDVSAAQMAERHANLQ
jgi:6-phospho-3-hexuloisomerase